MYFKDTQRETTPLKKFKYLVQKMKFSIKHFLSKCDRMMTGFGHIYWRNP